jgi:hypothetical protein
MPQHLSRVSFHTGSRIDVTQYCSKRMEDCKYHTSPHPKQKDPLEHQGRILALKQEPECCSPIHKGREVVRSKDEVTALNG